MTTEERPILFSGPMVCAILDGRKWQTRRVVKPQPSSGVVFTDELLKRCPYGQPGDRLWVRETWRFHEDETGLDSVEYRADNGLMQFPNDPNLEWTGDPFDGKWRPSIHMFRWMSRIDLNVIGVRVERLQDISEGDARAEGVLSLDGFQDAHPVEVFKYLWDSINGKKHPWKSNPWVWAVDFEQAHPNQ